MGGRVVRVVGCPVECMQVGGRVVRVVGCSVECMQVSGRVVRVVGCSVECMQVGGRVVRVVGWLCRVYAGGWKSSKSCGLALSSVCRWVEE